jgi:uncharacterized protein YceK
MQKNFATLAALLLLAGCGRFDEVKEHARCQQAHPNEQAAASECLKTATDKWAAAHAWLPRVTHRREPAP